MNRFRTALAEIVREALIRATIAAVALTAGVAAVGLVARLGAL